ncbi:MULTISPECIES: phosphoribosyltransferase family protein [Galbibacter]|uniref:Phosphoribosyltransferase family protein n=1 Tax=Galbibacter pacificus TaxID=2996052 RepID=A0ABT6FVD7_9FLAO|nr:phosphoribosyltransferase family protein [Galbibacter pacificus]MDG3583847.1 phosphoribosyltransferase family protein [Galbibacter pacificus]MDG3587235.1 phosphoribosyltransferase family protein [Galbibacter pacificus]
MTAQQNKILGHDEIQHKIKRIAYQIYETYVDEEEIVIAGIASGGLELAKKINDVICEISDIKTIFCEVRINKESLLEPVNTSLAEDLYKNKAVILVDDVLNSGGTLIYAVKHFLNVPLKKLKTVVLVDRNHKRYPVKADFKGISLSTSLQEHVSVVFKAEEDAVYLG